MSSTGRTDFEVEVTQSENTFIVRPKGDVVFGFSARKFKKELSRLNRRDLPNIQKVNLDFQQVAYIDSTGIGVLIQLHNMMEAEGVELVFTNLNEVVKDILELVALDQCFKVED